MARRGWTSDDVERWADPGVWVGDRAVGTLMEVRSAASRLASSWGLEVDEVVTFFWEALQSSSLSGADNKAAYVWQSVRRRVSTCAAGRDFLQGEREANLLKGPRAPVGGDESDFRGGRRAGGVETPFRGPVFDELTNVAGDGGSQDNGRIPAIDVAISVLIIAGWGRARATQVVESLGACAERISLNGATGFEAIANRLRRRPGNGGMAGLSRQQWLAAIRLVFGSRTSDPGVLPRVLGGETPQSVAECPQVLRLAQKVTSRTVQPARAASERSTAREGLSDEAA